MPRSHVLARLAATVGALALVGILPACGGASGSAAGGGSGELTVRLGYFPNLTHAPALVGVNKGFFATDLGNGVTLKTTTFNAGPSAIQALIGGSLDATFVGPNPAINGFIRSNGNVLRIVSGVTAGGAALLVQPDEHITSAQDLKGKKVATPQLGNTQDVALRAYLADHGLHTNPQGGGDVDIVPTDNSITVQLFKQHQLDGAWIPEPYASMLVDSAHAQVLVDEATLWPSGRFPTTELVVATSFLNDHPDAVRRLVQGNFDAINWIAANPTDAKSVVNDALKALTQKTLDSKVLDDAWSHLVFSADPQAAALLTEVQHAHDVGLLANTGIKGILDLHALDAVLQSAGKPAADAAGLGS